MNDQSSFWIMSPFNHLFIIVTIFFILLLVLVTRLMKNRTDRTKRAVIVSACILTLIGFIVYKIFLSLDSDFNVITSEMGGFNWWGELPLQLCNINMIMIPIAVLTRKRPLLSFCFFDRLLRHALYHRDRRHCHCVVRTVPPEIQRSSAYRARSACDRPDRIRIQYAFAIHRTSS